jgi:hypothetical protein
MLVIRDVFHCKPGKVRPMVEKFLAMKKIGEKAGLGSMKIMTDLSGPRFWTIVAEFEVESLEAFMAMDKDAELAKEFEQQMKGYHDLVDTGHREIFTLEG